MRDVEKRRGANALGAGKRELARHRPDLALAPLREAVAACPASHAADLAERLYWLAVALLRLDRAELAVKSLASAQKLRPRGHARRAYTLRVNDYGMPRRSKPELDDFYAFYSIQACRYLSARAGNRFGSNGEKDAVTRIIAESWTGLRGSGRLAGLCSGKKLVLFKSWPVAFPSFVSGLSGHQGQGKGQKGQPGEIVAGNFKSGRAQGLDERCSCGSGLAYRCCCGRLASPREFMCE
ncbi:MAG: hypothetical protein JNG85_00455 [Spirochaetaceae bacterium]|nr:hypothetical protein [Spirochaetaceae bacterium]